MPPPPEEEAFGCFPRKRQNQCRHYPVGLRRGLRPVYCRRLSLQWRKRQLRATRGLCERRAIPNKTQPRVHRSEPKLTYNTPPPSKPIARPRSGRRNSLSHRTASADSSLGEGAFWLALFHARATPRNPPKNDREKGVQRVFDPLAGPGQRPGRRRPEPGWQPPSLTHYERSNTHVHLLPLPEWPA